MSVPQQCVNSSKDCDIKVQDFCNDDTNYNKFKDFCGCSSKVLANAPDPKLGAAPVKCWAQSCNKNAKAYQFEFVKKNSGENPILLFDDIFDKLDETRVEKIIEMVNNSDFGQLFISDTHPERTEAIIKSTHQSYKIFNL